jgi:protein-disulfide isomerase
MRARFWATALAATTMAFAAAPAMAASAQVPDVPAPWRSISDVGALLPQDRVAGPAQAPVSVVVWSDPECPYCKQFSGVPDSAIAHAQGKANLAIRLLPLPFHGAAAVLGGMAAMCVADQGGSGAYYRFLADYFARTNGGGRGLVGGRAAVVALAKQDGAADGAKLDACLRSDDTLGRISAEGDAAERATVQGTPAVAVRNNTSGETIMVDGAIDEATLSDAISLMAERTTRRGPPPADYSR